MNKYNFQFLGWRLILNSTFLILNSKVNPPVNFVDILPYKGRQTPLTPLHRGGLGLLAFSLIELSIVLIIIGLLVVGVTGGKSLIESAKARALMNEIRNYKQAVNTYYAANGRLPGDKNNTGIIDYNGGAFEELNDEGIMDCNEFTNCNTSNVYKDVRYDYPPFSSDYNDYNLPYDTTVGNFLVMQSKNYSGGTRIPIKVGKSIDEKMDDGIYDTGSVLGLNTEYDEYNYEIDEGLSYDEAMKKKNWYTDEMYFRLDIQ